MSPGLIIIIRYRGEHLKQLFIAAFVAVLFLADSPPVNADKPVKVGIATILSGDLAVVGDSIRKSVEAYQELFPYPRLEFVYEDARLSSQEGLQAYRRLINVTGVDLVIAACTSNGTMAGISLFEQTKTPVISVSTGGSNIDRAGDFVFRIGNSDSLNGIQQADYFLQNKLTRVAMLTEQTEYTQDIARFFRDRFHGQGGTLALDEEFLPGTSDFRTIATRIREAAPDAIFIPAQTGTALGIFLRQWHKAKGKVNVPVHTTFVAGPNRDAHAAAGAHIVGVHYMDPAFSEANERRKQLFLTYKRLFGTIPFHTAGIADTLNLVSQYLKENPRFDQETFRSFLLNVRHYDGMLGELTFDEHGNTAIGFRMMRVEKSLVDRENHRHQRRESVPTP